LARLVLDTAHSQQEHGIAKARGESHRTSTSRQTFLVASELMGKEGERAHNIVRTAKESNRSNGDKGAGTKSVRGQDSQAENKSQNGVPSFHVFFSL